MRAGIMKCFKISLFLFVLCLCLSAFSKSTAWAAAPVVKLNVKSVSIIKDGTFALKVYNTAMDQMITFSSKDEEIATVSQAGVITGVSSGSTVITAAVYEDGKRKEELTCNVTIGPKATNVKLTKFDLVLAVGGSKLLRVNLDPINTVEQVKFYSSDAQIASVSSSGRVRAKEPGQIKIYAFISNGKQSVCNVTVLSEEDYAKYLEEKNAETAAETPAAGNGDAASEPGSGADTTPTPTPTGTPVA